MIEQLVYGVQIASVAPLFDSLPGASPGACADSPTIYLRQVSPWSADHDHAYPLFRSHARDVVLHTQGELRASEEGQPWRLTIGSLLTFAWHGHANEIHYWFGGDDSQPLLSFWFVHVFLPVFLTLEVGYDFLHASAVELDPGPVLFVAPSENGKSTLANYFLRQGHALISDDKVATRFYQDKFAAVPSYPYHRPRRKLEELGDPVGNFATRSRPIHAVYLLERGEPDTPAEITELTGLSKYERLMPNYLYNFSFLQESRLRWMAAFIDKCPVFSLRQPWSLERQDQVYAAICAHSNRITPAGW